MEAMALNKWKQGSKHIYMVGVLSHVRAVKSVLQGRKNVSISRIETPFLT